MKRREQQGVALVVTLILLAIITIVVVAFLGVTQRNRALTSTATDQINAQFMADAGLERAQAEVAARLLSQPELAPVQMLVSTNFINWGGFDPAAPPAQRFFNINYTRTRFDDPNAPAAGFGPIYDPSLGLPLAYDQLMQVLTNLYYNPRPPVFVRTNPSPIFPADFRFYLDLNRNGRFDATGTQLVLDDDFEPLVQDGTFVRAGLVGDPEWIGVLQHPDQPHSATNRFIGRYAYLVVPEGLTLDLNAAHNYAKTYAVPGGNLDLSMNSGDRFLRNSGVGTYEMNLAGFLVGLNTNLWPGPRQTGNPVVDYNYDAGTLGAANTGLAFNDAWSLLRYRHRADPFNAASASLNNLFNYEDLYGNGAAAWVITNRIDEYANGPLALNENLPLVEGGPDDPTVSPWSGSPYPNRFLSLDDVFDPQKAPAMLPGQLSFPEKLNRLAGSNSTYNSGTYYRLLSQLGTESGLEPESFVPGLGVDAYTATNVNPILPYRPEDKINLNWDNRDLRNVPGVLAADQKAWKAADLKPWEPLAFFTNVAARMLRSQEFRGTDGRLISLNNIRVWPTNDYDGAVHRILQVAANLYDAVNNTNASIQTAAGDSQFPHVFRPIFRTEIVTGQTNIYVAGFQEVENVANVAVTNLVRFTSNLAESAFWNLNIPAHRDDLIQKANAGQPQKMVLGIPMVIGAKKGFPNFNEIAMETYLQVQRNLYLRRPTTTSRPNLTNEVYFLGISNVVAVEAWNSYQTAFPRDLLIAVEVDYDVSLLSTNVGAANNTIPRRVVDQAGRPFAASSFASGLIDVPATGPNSWAGRGAPPTFSPGSFKIPLATNFPSLPNSVWFPNGPGFTKFQTATGSLTSPISPAPGLSANEFFTPDWNIALTNRVRMVVVDKATSRIVDYVNIDRMTWSTNVIQALRLVEENTTRESVFAQLFDMNRVGGGNLINVPTVGSWYQMQIALGFQSIDQKYWQNYNSVSRPTRDKNLAIDAFRRFADGLPPLFVPGFQNPVDPSGLYAQVPYSPTVMLRLKRSYQANDPLVHYTSYDMATPVGRNDAELIPVNAARALSGKPENIGFGNQRYKPWGEGEDGNDPTAANPVYIDPLITSSDDWNFPDHKLPNVGWIGRVHRGTPWQTVYLKSISKVSYDPNTGQRGAVDNALALQDLVTTWYGPTRTRGAANEYGLRNYATPDKDWRFLDLFTVAPNANATRGQVSVNQFGEATWSAVLSGVLALTNDNSGPSLAGFNQSYSRPVVIQPGSTQLRRIVEGINQTRAGAPFNGQYLTRGDILAVPELSLSSPYLDQSKNPIQQGISDVALERIPQQIMSLLRLGDPRVVVYAYGQALQPAPFSINLDPNYLNVVTNYQVTGEYATRSVVKFERLPPDPNFQNLTNQNRLRAVVLESKVLPPQ
jgi:hypothetical protein